jgi:hypothetical protein
MKIAIQVSTPSMGDVVIEVAEDKNTTNIEQQKGILVELIFDVIRKIQAVYSIPKGMLDLEDYENADSRFQAQQALPKPSSAERNRQEAKALEEEQLQKQEQKHPHKASKNKKNKKDKHAHAHDNEDVEVEPMELSEEEQILALTIIDTLRQLKEDKLVD